MLLFQEQTHDTKTDRDDGTEEPAEIAKIHVNTTYYSATCR